MGIYFRSYCKVQWIYMHSYFIKKYFIPLFIILVSLLFFLVSPSSGYAQGANMQCGDANNPDRNKCCTFDDVDTSSLNMIEKDDKEWGCINFLGWKPDWACISNILSGAGESVKNVLSEDIYDELGDEIACQTAGTPTIDGKATLDIRNDACICLNIDNDNSVAKMCSDYIIPYINKDMNPFTDEDKERLTAEKLLDNEEYVGCLDCFTNGGYWSALGCVQIQNWQEFISQNIFGLLVGIGGAASLLCIIYASFMIQISQGNAEKIQDARDLLTSCIIGFLVIIFSVFILRIIGYDILRLPGMGGGIIKAGEVCREANGNLLGVCEDGYECPEMMDKKNRQEQVCEPVSQ